MMNVVLSCAVAARAQQADQGETLSGPHRHASLGSPPSIRLEPLASVGHLEEIVATASELNFVAS